MSNITENDNGLISVDDEVIAQFAGHAALDCFGIVGMASLSMKDGLAKLLKGDNVSRGVSVNHDDDGLVIDFHIIIAYGVNIKTVVDNLVKTVRYQLEDYTAMHVKDINVYVEGVRVID
ncbi:MAG: Asp23/Gls24 family envelope stress response protein [Eubacterium sp.]|nr:Asp23/Gls24 family envelope stress response protein [Eubacterium sp.]